ncbi:vacuolar fusion protein MON1-like protein A-like protein [Geranomyces variabilis]|nr:vacuolar fusion protein MON1-like protein A-like protein [Geranomyces variabilis]KAJ3134189.1 Vacuolar fusion protein mon1b [Geranomyces variabilis]
MPKPLSDSQPPPSLSRASSAHSSQSAGPSPPPDASKSIDNPPDPPSQTQPDFSGKALVPAVPATPAAAVSTERHKRVGELSITNAYKPPTGPGWTNRRKHFFILSCAGKPIYSRYGDEAKLSSLMGLIQAIISFFASDDDSVRSLTAGGHTFVFSVKGPLYLVAVSSTGESVAQLRQQLSYLHSQILFILTSTQLTRIFDTRVNYDLRNLLSGTEMFLDQLARSFQSTPGFFLGSVQCLRMPARVRQKVAQALSVGNPQGLAFGMLLAKDQLIGLIRPKRHSLHPADLHLVANMIASSSGFRSGEAWTPVCLPMFNNKAFLHAYVCYVGPDLCVVLCSTDKDSFFEMSEYKAEIVKGLEEGGCVDGIDEALHGVPYSIVEVGVPSLRHFIVKSTPLVQYTQPAPAPPYTRKDDWRRLLQIYQRASEALHARIDPVSTYFYAGPAEAVLACTVGTLELYAAFGPLVSKNVAMDAINALARWARRCEDLIFLGSVPVLGSKQRSITPERITGPTSP